MVRTVIHVPVLTMEGCVEPQHSRFAGWPVLLTRRQCVEEFAWTANFFDCESRRDIAYRDALENS
jgi:hypothetical protein